MQEARAERLGRKQHSTSDEDHRDETPVEVILTLYFDWHELISSRDEEDSSELPNGNIEHGRTIPLLPCREKSETCETSLAKLIRLLFNSMIELNHVALLARYLTSLKTLTALSIP